MLLNTIEGNTQNWILPIPTQRGGSPRQASGPANTFTFKECIDAVSNVSPPRCQVEAPDPTNKRTVEQVANELKAAGYVNEFKPKVINFNKLKTGNVYAKMVRSLKSLSSC